MRKSTLVILGILAAGLGALLFAMKTYTDQFLEEVRLAKDATTALQDRLEPGSTVRLARVAGQTKYVVADPLRPGLLVEARPAAREWPADPHGRAFARDLWALLEPRYGPERPVEWMQFRLTRPDGTQEPLFGLERGEHREVRLVPPAPGGAPPGR